jgi:hypothetical protein
VGPFGAPFGPPGGTLVGPLAGTTVGSPFPEGAEADPDWEDPNCFGCGDGVINDFNNLFYFNSEFLLWWMRGQRPPPLVVSSNPFAMMLGGPPGVGLFGGGMTGDGVHTGYRFRTGLWFDRDHSLGLEGSFFFLSQRSNEFRFGSAGMPILVVPFIDANTGLQSGRMIASPGMPGSVMASVKTRLWGADANLRGNLWCGPNGHVDLLGGFRALGLDDDFQFGTNTTLVAPVPMSVLLNDRFATRNRFYGGQLGVSGEYRRGAWSVDGTLKVALGGTNQRLEIGGNNVVNGVAGIGGIFAQPSNLRDTSRDRFGVVPELGVNVGYQVTDHLRAYVGYNFLYWSSVIRAGEQIPRSINPVQMLSGPTLPSMAPAFAFKGTDFWVHGVNFGLEFRY